MTDVEVVLNLPNVLGEGPMWIERESALYWVDIEAHCFYRLDPAAGQYTRFDVGQPVGTVVLRESGGALLALRDGFAFYDMETRKLTPIADPEADRPESRFNDGAVDRQGRFWAGTMAEDQSPVGALYRLDRNLRVQRMESGIHISNGIGWSPDNRIMYYTDSRIGTIFAYDFDADTGEIANRRVFVHVDEGSPDGLTVDSDGFIWSARWDGWKIVRYDPQGKPEREVALPVQRPTSCVFGGENLDELYITSAQTGLDAAARQAQPLAGALLRYRPGVTGIAEPLFGG